MILRCLKVVIERKIVNRISIDTESSKSVRELINRIHNAEKQNKVKLLKIEFESPGKSTKKETMSFGKDGKVKAVFGESSITIPRQTRKITNNYTIVDLIDAIDALEVYAIRNIPTYIFDAYPNSLTLLDKGRSPSFGLHIVIFAKVRGIDSKSTVAKLLENIHMPMDLIGIYKAVHNPKAAKDDNVIPYKKTEVLRDINGNEKYVEADDVFNYTGNLYHSEFTIVTSCEVGIETRKTKQIVPVEGGSCKIIPKKPEKEETLKDENSEQKEEEKKKS